MDSLIECHLCAALLQYNGQPHHCPECILVRNEDEKEIERLQTYWMSWSQRRNQKKRLSQCSHCHALLHSGKEHICLIPKLQNMQMESHITHVCGVDSPCNIQETIA